MYNETPTDWKVKGEGRFLYLSSAQDVAVKRFAGQGMICLVHGTRAVKDDERLANNLKKVRNGGVS